MAHCAPFSNSLTTLSLLLSSKIGWKLWGHVLLVTHCCLKRFFFGKGEKTCFWSPVKTKKKFHLKLLSVFNCLSQSVKDNLTKMEFKNKQPSLILVILSKSLICTQIVGTMSLDRWTFNQNMFNPGWLWLVSDTRSFKYDWIEI